MDSLFKGGKEGAYKILFYSLDYLCQPNRQLSNKDHKILLRCSTELDMIIDPNNILGSLLKQLVSYPTKDFNFYKKTRNRCFSELDAYSIDRPVYNTVDLVCSNLDRFYKDHIDKHSYIFLKEVIVRIDSEFKYQENVNAFYSEDIPEEETRSVKAKLVDIEELVYIIMCGDPHRIYALIFYMIRLINKDKGTFDIVEMLIITSAADAFGFELPDGDNDVNNVLAAMFKGMISKKPCDFYDKWETYKPREIDREFYSKWVPEEKLDTLALNIAITDAKNIAFSDARDILNELLSM